MAILAVLILVVIVAAICVATGLWGSLSSRVDELLRINREQIKTLRELEKRVKKIETASEAPPPPLPIPDDVEKVIPLAVPKVEVIVPPPPPPEEKQFPVLTFGEEPEPVIEIAPAPIVEIALEPTEAAVENIPPPPPQTTPWTDRKTETSAYRKVEKKEKPPKEEAPNTILSRIWSWVIVGEEFRPKNVSLEYAVATTWLVRGAVLTLLTATAFFLRWAYERNLIRPEFRVGLTVLFGLGLLGGGLYLFRGKYRVIGLGLVGVGFGALYFSVYSAQSLYHLCGQGSAIFFTFLITIAAVGVAVWKNMLPVAIIGTLAGYAAPLVFSSGSRNLTGLYGYMLLLALGVGAANFKRNWKLLNLIAFVGTWGIYALSLLQYSRNEFPAAITFLGLYSLFFALLPLIYAVGHRRNINAFGILGTIANFFLTLGIGILLVQNAFGWRLASIVPFALALLLGILFAASRALDRKDDGLEAFYTVLTIGCLALGVGLSFGEAFITFTWALMALALFGAAWKMRYTKLLNTCGGILFGIAAGRFLIVDFRRYFWGVDAFSPGAADRLLTLGALILIAGVASWFFLRKDKLLPSQIFAVFAIVGLWYYGFHEIGLLLGGSYVILYWVALAAGLFGCGRTARLKEICISCGAIIFGGAILRFGLWDFTQYFLSQPGFSDHALQRLLTLGVLTAGAYLSAFLFRNQKFKDDEVFAALEVFALLGVIGSAVYGSFEIHLLLGASYLIPFWVGMGIVLFAAARNPRLQLLLKICGSALFVLACGRFCFFIFNSGSHYWTDTVYSSSLWERLLTLGSITAGSGGAWYLFRRKGEQVTARIFGSTALAFLWFYGTYEVGFFLKQWNGEKAGITVWWGVFALGLLLGGILKRSRILRRLALTLFAVTVVKIFFFDLKDLEQIYRIGASALLALALLAAAFTYIRFRDKFET